MHFFNEWSPEITVRDRVGYVFVSVIPLQWWPFVMAAQNRSLAAKVFMKSCNTNTVQCVTTYTNVIINE